MNEMLIVILRVVSWLIWPFLGLFVGILNGLLYRAAGGINSKFPNGFEIGVAVGILITTIMYIGWYYLLPSFWQGINIPEFAFKTVIGYILYILIGEFTMRLIAGNAKKG